MTRRSGWCSDWQGVCSSNGMHAICSDRLARGLLDACGCPHHNDETAED